MYIRHRNACRIYCGASAEQSRLPAAVCLEIYVCLTAHSSAESSAIASLLALHRLPANKFAPLRLLRIFGCALLAAYTVAPRHSSLCCLPASYLEIYGCLAAPADAASLCRCKQVCSASAPDICRFACYISRLCDANFLLYSRLLRIFGCALLAAYTVAPRHSSLCCLPQSVWRYMCALRSTHLQNPLQLQACLHCTGFLQTSLHRSGFCVYSAALCLPHIL